MSRDFTRQEAAEYLDVHVNTLDRWKKKGKLSYRLTPGGIARYPFEELARFKDGRLRLAREESEISERAQRTSGELGELARKKSSIVSHIERAKAEIAAAERELTALVRRVG
ncbi:MAG: helix-turn-helix domain-containing protein [Acidobacteria bacterium]|nr:helix-turn-helix domain-containing protein [Acidobacteriota bacterium]